jgi:hypothetical protein
VRSRARAALDASQVARELELSPDDARILCRVDPAALDAQAKALVDKRRAEVKRIAPRTWKQLGAEGAALFDAYAAHHWPTGHLRHGCDALAFLRWLSDRGLPHDRIELLRLDTRLSGRRRRIAWVRGGGLGGMPVLYCGWTTRGGWREWLLHIGPARL